MGLRHERICHERSADYRHAAHVRAAVLPADLGIRLRGMPWSAPEDLGSWPAAFCRRRVLGCSALGAVFAALVYIMAAPLAQPDMVDFYRMYRPGALIFLLGLFIIQFVFGVAAVYRGK